MLRGIGVTVALPWLESLPVWGDEPVRNQLASEAPVRLAVLFAGNGFHSKEWWAKGEGSQMELGAVLSPPQDFREKMLVVRGLFNAEALKGNIHSSQTGNLLSGAPLASGGEIRSGTSIDQIMAQRCGNSTKVPSLVLGLRSLIHPSTRITRCCTARISPGARRLPRPRLRFTRRWRLTGCLRMK